MAVRLCRSWASVYTRGLPAEITERRLLEIESDLWDHLHDPDTAEREILGRMLRGIHADVWWRYRTLLESSGARQRSHDMTTTTRNWWTPATVAISIAVATLGLLAVVIGGTASGAGVLGLQAGVPAVGGLVILAGIVAQRQRPTGGSRLVLIGAVLTASDPLFIPVAAFVIIGGLWSGRLTLSEERPDVIRLQATRRRMTERWYFWLVIAGTLASVGFGAIYVQESTGFVPDNCTEFSPCWEDTAAWATWVLSFLGAMATGGVGVVLGVLRFFDRHHTRPA